MSKIIARRMEQGSRSRPGLAAPRSTAGKPAVALTVHSFVQPELYSCSNALKKPQPLRMMARAPGNVRLLLGLGHRVPSMAPVEGVAKSEASRCRPYRSDTCGMGLLPLEARCKRNRETLATIRRPQQRRILRLASLPANAVGGPAVSRQSHQRWRNRSCDATTQVIGVSMAPGPTMIGSQRVGCRRQSGGYDGFISHVVVTGTARPQDPARRLCRSTSIHTKPIPRKARGEQSLFRFCFERIAPSPRCRDDCASPRSSARDPSKLSRRTSSWRKRSHTALRAALGLATPPRLATIGFRRLCDDFSCWETSSFCRGPSLASQVALVT